MNDIQKARDVLVKWREKALPGAWSKEENVDYEGTPQAAITTLNGPLTWDDHNGEVFDPNTAGLIVGTAGNPDLLDAIEGLLSDPRQEHVLGWYAHKFATAIIAADERMQQ